MSFTRSTFTIEINGLPTVVFQAKWQVDADRICRDWLYTHWDQLSERGPGGLELPPMFKLRLARASEREAYEVGGTGFEFCGVVKVVNLIEVVDQLQTEAEQPAEHSSEYDAGEDGKGRDDDSVG